MNLQVKEHALLVYWATPLKKGVFMPQTQLSQDWLFVHDDVISENDETNKFSHYWTHFYFVISKSVILYTG